MSGIKIICHEDGTWTDEGGNPVNPDDFAVLRPAHRPDDLSQLTHQHIEAEMERVREAKEQGPVTVVYEATGQVVRYTIDSASETTPNQEGQA